MTPCDVCQNDFKPGEWYVYHSRLDVYVHSNCASRAPVRGEDISTQTVMFSKVPQEEA
jgi:hypothetical protein